MGAGSKHRSTEPFRSMQDPAAPVSMNGASVHGAGRPFDRRASASPARSSFENIGICRMPFSAAAETQSAPRRNQLSATGTSSDPARQTTFTYAALAAQSSHKTLRNCVKMPSIVSAQRPPEWRRMARALRWARHPTPASLPLTRNGYGKFRSPRHNDSHLKQFQRIPFVSHARAALGACPFFDAIFS
jgi:hypothetical protein